MNNKRLVTITEKIGTKKTGLNAALYVHMDFTPDRALKSVRFSHKGKDLSTLDNILTALGDAVTQIMEDEGR